MRAKYFTLLLLILAWFISLYLFIALLLFILLIYRNIIVKYIKTLIYHYNIEKETLIILLFIFIFIIFININFIEKIILLILVFISFTVGPWRPSAALPSAFFALVAALPTSYKYIALVAAVVLGLITALRIKRGKFQRIFINSLNINDILSTLKNYNIIILKKMVYIHILDTVTRR